MRLSPRIRERRKKERMARAARIVAAARHVFARHGIKDATMEMIAREAKVAVGTLYLHFSSRDELYLTLSIESGERLLERFAEVKARRFDLLDEVSAIAMEYVDHFRDPRYSYLVVASSNVADIRKRIRSASEVRKFNRLTEIRREIVGAVETTMRRACDAGQITNPFGPTMASALLWAILKGALELIGDSEFWRDVTGLDQRHFVEQLLQSMIGTWRRPPLQQRILDGADPDHHLNSASVVESAKGPLARTSQAQPAGDPFPSTRLQPSSHKL